MTCESVDEIKNIANNKVIFENLEMRNSKITFFGKNNVLVCDKNVVLNNTVINFYGDNSIVYLGENRFDYSLVVGIYNNSVLHFGRNTYINGTLTINLSEQKHVFFGNDGIISSGIVIRNADPHLIYSTKTYKRLNQTKSIYIGDHVWLGQECMVLKGTQIDSGAIIGARSVVSGKKIMHNSSWAGNPVRKIKEDVFWDGCCVHSWCDDKTKNSALYNEFVAKYFSSEDVDKWIYEFKANENVSFDQIDKKLSEIRDVEEKLLYLRELNNNTEKNRFVH